MAGINCSAPLAEGGRVSTRVVKSNYVGYGVVRESGAKHSIDRAGDGGVEGLSDWMACCLEWIEGPQSTGGCGSCAG
jgi:hypothetical protein